MNCSQFNSILLFSANLAQSKKQIQGHESFNIIKAIVRGKLHETSHSNILAELLRSDEMIRISFIEEFIETGIYIKGGKCNIDVEKDGIDICIEFGNYVVIIENKVNNAPEQKSQIDRYVTNKLDSYSTKQIYVLYLTRDYPAPPSEYSWSETKGKCRIILKTYRKDITNWIKKIYEADDRYYSLHTALYQYKTYLEYIFDNNNAVMDIPKELKDIIDGQIAGQTFGDVGCESKIKAVKDLSDKLSEVYNICKSYQWQLTWQNIREQINAKLKIRNMQLFDMKEMDWDLPDAGIPFMLDGSNEKFYAVVSYLQGRYIGIIHYNHTNAYDQNITDKLVQILSDKESSSAQLTDSQIYSTRRYPYWFKETNDKSLVDKYLHMVEILKNNDKVQFLDKPHSNS